MTKNTRQKRKKSSEDDTIERLEKEIRELKTINRSLLRRLKKVDKNYSKALEEEENAIDDVYEPPKVYKKYCDQCGKGSVEEVVVAGRKFVRCGLCGYRSRAEKI